MKFYLDALKKYAVFTGRATRQDYWMFVLFNIIFVILLSIVEAILGLDKSADQEGGPLVQIYQLALFLPSIAIAIRRMHDINKSGWFILIPIYNIILACRAGDLTENKYGPSANKAKVLATNTPAEKQPKAQEPVFK